jgi:hypothetical protein
MKRTVLVLALAILVVGVGWAQEAEQRKSAVSFQFGGSFLAPVGAEAEFFLGSVGLSVHTRLLVLKLAGDWAGTLEPGMSLRVYFDGLDRSLFFFTGAGFLTLWSLSPFSFEQGILRPKAGFGYNFLLGKDSRYRLGFEVGAAWLQNIVEGDLRDIVFPLVPHFLLVFGRAF